MFYLTFKQTNKQTYKGWNYHYFSSSFESKRHPVDDSGVSVKWCEKRKMKAEIGSGVTS